MENTEQHSGSSMYQKASQSKHVQVSFPVLFLFQEEKYHWLSLRMAMGQPPYNDAIDIRKSKP